MKHLCSPLAILLAALCFSALAAAPVVGADADSLKIDMSKWSLNTQDDVWYQIGVPYCATPADAQQQTVAIFVPGAYFTGEKLENGLYRCAVNPEKKVNGFAAGTAPVAFPVDTPGYMPQAPLTEYQSFAQFTKRGFVYLHAGCRGRVEGAPRGVTDLKAAIRWFRHNAESLPGNPDRIFSFGMSGGGAQSALLGATGNAPEYEPYLKEIGAVPDASDALFGAMCWCPVTSLETSDPAYEWFMGATRQNLSESDKLLSDNLAALYPAYVNSLKLRSPDGKTLTVDEGEFKGSFCDYVLAVVQDSLNKFLADTEFPYDGSKATERRFPPRSRAVLGQFGANRPAPAKATGKDQPFEARDNIARSNTNSGLKLTGTYNTAQEYVDALNAQEKWVEYDPATNSAKVLSLAAFVRFQKVATKGLAAFDQLDSKQGENVLFGYGDGAGAHFDPNLYAVLTGVDKLKTANADVAKAFETDLARKDSVGKTVDVRLRAYSPIYYLLEGQPGFGTSDVAPQWRIRTGIRQSDTSLTTEINLALALQMRDDVKGVDFETVWGQFHTKAERKGESEANFIQWAEEFSK